MLESNGVMHSKFCGKIILNVDDFSQAALKREPKNPYRQEGDECFPRGGENGE